MIEIHAIGGYNEIGKNMTAIVYKNEAIILDMGLYLDPYVKLEEGERENIPASYLTKIGAIASDGDFFKTYGKKVKAIILGHAHLDHCVHPDSYVQLANGEIDKIGNIVKDTKVGCIDFKTKRYDPTYCRMTNQLKSPKSLLDIRTRSKRLKVTGEHRFFVLNDSLQIVNKRAEDLKAGDRVAVMKTIPFDGDPQKISDNFLQKYIRINEDGRKVLRAARIQSNLSQKALAKKVGVHHSPIQSMETKGDCPGVLDKVLTFFGIEKDSFYKKYAFKVADGNVKIAAPKRTSPDLCQFIGYILGDGNKTRRDVAHPKSYLRATDKDIENLKLYGELGAKLFNVKYTITYRSRCKTNSRNRVNFSSPNLPKLLNALDPHILCVSPKRRVPKVVPKCPNKEVAAFLRGLYDAEGSVRDHSIVLTSTSEDIITVIQMLLLRFGIYSHIYDSTITSAGNPSYQLVIYYDKSIKKFRELINFGSKIKHDRLDMLANKTGKGIGERIDLYPVSGFLKNAMRAFNLRKIDLRKAKISEHHYLKGHCMSKDKLAYCLKVLEGRYDSAENPEFAEAMIANAKAILNSEMLFEPIKSVQTTLSDTENVIDITVPGHSNFIANGFVVHNCGGVRWQAEKYDCPIVTTPYTAEVLKRMAYEDKWQIKNKLTAVNLNSTYKVSNNLSIEFVYATHSIVQAAITVVHTPEGSIVYTPDYKLDNTPAIGQKTNIERLKALAVEREIKAVLVDCTQADKEQKTFSERIAKDMLRDVLVGVETQGHGIIVTTFASHLPRLKSIIEIGEELGRKIVFIGRTMERYIGAAEDLGLVNFTSKIELIKFWSKAKKRLNDIARERHKYLLAVTGNQGEPNAMLSRISRDETPFNVMPGDIVVFSCNTIPTPQIIKHREVLEKALKSKKARMFKDIHVSGHASKEDHRDMIKLLRPEHIIPAHGDVEKREKLAELASEMGFSKGKTIHMIKDGDKLVL